MPDITSESDLSQLTILGQPAQPSKTLETFPNHHPDRPYVVTLGTNEFTCLCPLTGQPDFARITLSYIPHKALVESKSLKLYLASFRNEGAFHEHVTNIILDDLTKALAPRWCKVTAEFAVRGGIAITVHAECGQVPAASSPPLAAAARTAEKSHQAEPAATEKSRFKATPARWDKGGDKKPTEWEQKARAKTPYGKPAEDKRFERGKPRRTETDTWQERRSESPVKREERPEWDKKKSERHTTKSLGVTRTWRKRT